MRRLSPAVVFALVAVLATACAEGAGAPDPTGTPPATPVATSPGATDPAPGAPPAPTTAPTGPLAPPTAPRGAEMTLTGEVVAGVEHGCKLLATGEEDYLLFGELSRDLQFGTTVTVRGQVRPDLASTCQQGTPFEVTEVHVE